MEIWRHFTVNVLSFQTLHSADKRQKLALAHTVWLKQLLASVITAKELWFCLHDFVKLVLKHVIVPEIGLPTEPSQQFLLHLHLCQEGRAVTGGHSYI